MIGGDEYDRQLHAPDLDQAEHDRQLQPAAGDEHRRGNRRRPRSSAGGPGDEHDRQLQAPDLDQAERGRQPTAAPSTSAVAPGDEHRRGNRRRPW